MNSDYYVKAFDTLNQTIIGKLLVESGVYGFEGRLKEVEY